MAIESNLAGVARVAFEAETGEFNRDVSQAEQRYKTATQGMSDSAIRLELAQNRLHRALAKGPANYQAIARAELAVRKETEALTREQNQLQKELAQSERTLGRFVRGAVAGSGAMRGFGRSIAFTSSTFLGGAGLAYAFKSTLDLAGQFQRSLNILQGVTGASAKEMAAAAEEAKRLGRDVTLPATSALDAANAMTELSKAGFGMRDSIGGAEGVLRLAAAASIEVGAAAKIASRSLNAFGLAGDQAGKIADLFAAVANAATGEIPDFGLALSQSAAVAKAWNLDINEVVATLGVLANNAIVGSDAGTSLRVMLTRLVPVSKAASDKMEELGLTAFKASGEIKPYRQILQEYHDVLVKLPPEQQKLAIQTIFGQDAQRIANKLIVEGIGSYDKMLKKVGQLDAAQQLAAARNKGYVGALDAFRSAVETLQITVGTALLPIFTDALKSATDWVNKMEKSGEATEQVKGAVEDAVEVFKALRDIFVGIKTVADPAIEAVGGIKNAVEILAGVWVAMKVKSLFSFGAMAAASKATSASMIADAAAAGAAWGAVPIGGGVPMGGPRGTRPVPVPPKKGPWWKSAAGVALGSVAARNAAIGTAVVISQTPGATSRTGAYEPKRYPRIARLLRKIESGGRLTDYERSLLAPFGNQAISDLNPSQLRSLETNLVGQSTAPGLGGDRDRPNMGRAPSRVPRPGGGRGGGAGGGARGDGLTALDRAEIAAAEAATPRQELAAERRILALYEQELKSGNLTGEKLKDLRIKIGNQRETVRNIEEGIARDAKQADDERKRKQKERVAERKRAYRERIAATEQELRNVFEQAVEAPGRRGERRAFIALRNYLKARVNDARLTDKEQAQAQKRLIKLRKDWTAANVKAHKEELELQEKTLENDAAAADLSEENTAKRLKAHRRLRDFYRRQEKDTDLTREARQEARGKRIDEQKEINEILKGEKEEADKLRQEMGSVLSDFAGFQHQFLTGMISQFVGGTGSGNAMQTNALEQFTLQGNRERSAQTGYLRQIAHRAGGRLLDEALMP